MNEREFFRARRHAEFPAFIRVLQALPSDRLEYRPHERSPSAAQIAWTLAGELHACCEMVANRRVDWNPTVAPTLDEIIGHFECDHARLDELVAGLDDEGWQSTGQFLVGTRVAMEQTIGAFLWLFLFDAIHHRGQLSAYIRPMGGRVPSIYGPSGDAPA